jgi:hypothetical protein
VPVSTELAVQDCKLRGVCSGPWAKELTSQRGPIDTVLVARVMELAWRCGTAVEAGECGGPPPSADGGRGRMPTQHRRRMSTWWRGAATAWRSASPQPSLTTRQRSGRRIWRGRTCSAPRSTAGASLRAGRAPRPRAGEGGIFAALAPHHDDDDRPTASAPLRMTQLPRVELKSAFRCGGGGAP